MAIQKFSSSKVNRKKRFSQAVQSTLKISSVIGVGLFSQATLAKEPIQKLAESVPGEILVQLKDGVQSLSQPFQAQTLLVNTLAKTIGSQNILSVQPLQTDKTIFKLRVAKSANSVSAINTLKANPIVKYAEPNFVYHKMNRTFEEVVGIPNDPDFSKLWGISNVGQVDAAGQTGSVGSDINVLPIWKMGYTGSKNIKVAVIDTGVLWNHKDLVSNVWTNAGEIADNGIDDDGNGFIDDVHGWNFVDNTNRSSDDNDHGTHCAGTIGGVGNDGIGIVGVNWNVSIVPIKFLSASGSGSLDGAVESIKYATSVGVNLMSNSWGGGGFSEIMKESIEKARDKGILFVAAAGNDSSDNDGSPTYPASYEVDNVLAVAATDNQDKIARFSNYGKRTVHVAAPGVKVYSSVSNGGYETLSGTSMATPHVSGVAALLMSIHPDWTYTELKKRLIETSTPIKGLKKKVVAKGRVNAYQALMGIVPPSEDPAENLWVTLEQVVESPHPYTEHMDTEYKVNIPGAKYIRAVFEKVDLEKGYDKLTLKDPVSGEVAEELTGKLENYTSEYIKGDSILMKFKSDESIQGWGFKISKVQVIY